MRIETQGLGIELKREGHAYVEYAVFAAVREYLPRIGLVNVCLRASDRKEAAVTCVMAADLMPSGRAVAAHRAGHPYAAIDRAAAELRRRIEQELRSAAVPPT
jgi:ribosome-associated translation inhibitor RaiA